LSASLQARYHRAPSQLTGRWSAAVETVPESTPQAIPVLMPHVLALDDDPSVRQLVSDYLAEN
jgi:hypothetical protein